MADSNLTASNLTALGLPHGFSTRHGGISTGPFAGLNLGNPMQGERDPWPRIAANYVTWKASMGVVGWPRVSVHQKHGRTVHVVRSRDETNDRRTGDSPWADALVTAVPGLLLTVRVADCVPILLADRHGRAIAAVHAGWRGQVAGILGETVRVLEEDLGVPPSDLLAAVGPCIGVDAFEVGPEVAEHFRATGLAEAVVPGEAGARPHVDLVRGTVMQLEAAGIPADAIETLNRCTHAEPDTFYSHRRDGEPTGRMAAAIGLRSDRTRTRPAIPHHHGTGPPA